ncbi:MAG: N-acetyl-gamma-glutamyl-phosphate reductase, partial [Bacteroidales bacterium]|nr:N-acetyl-gamma-glutamyl-phosphate reductase [Bacteroidales bacterium]
LGLLPLAKAGLLRHDVSVNAITGSTGAGQKPGATTHFSWRSDNMSVYKVFTHQHLHEIRQSLAELQGSLEADLDFIPYRGGFTRGIFCTSVVKFDGEEGSSTNPSAEQLADMYRNFYKGAAFTFYTDKALDLKQVVNTNKALVHIDKFGNKAVISSVVDNLLKGAVGQAVQNMNLMFGLPEDSGLRLKASAF